jgi:imidazolonepropionase-like amidohydrolase
MIAIGPHLLYLLAAVTPPAPPPPLAITHVTVVDVTGGPSQPNMTVIVRAGRIASIERSSEGSLPKDLLVVEGRGKFLIPGLWDMHVHVSWTTASALPVLVATGVTSVRDLGGRLGQIDEWRALIAAGVLTGPRILRAGPILNGKAFNPLQMVPGTPDESRGVVRTLAQVGGVDFVKVHRRLPRDVYFAVIDEATKQGLTVVGHIPIEVTPAEATWPARSRRSGRSSPVRSRRKRWPR